MQEVYSRIKDRDSGIELFRIVAAIAVVMLHFRSKIMEVSPSVLWDFVESLCIWAVDGFIVISGFFLSRNEKRTWGSVLKLLFQYEMIHVGIYVIQILLQRQIFSISTLFYCILPTNYYIVLYIVLYLVSPFINKCLNTLLIREKKVFIFMILVLFSLYPTLVDLLGDLQGTEVQGLSSIGVRGSQQGFNIVHFCLMYCVGSYLRTSSTESSMLTKKHQCTMLFIVSSLIVVFWAVLENGLKMSSMRSAWVYHNPFVILQAVSIFSFFRCCHIRSRIINELASATLTCFLFHNQIVARLPLEKMATYPAIVIIVLALTISVGILILSWVLNKVFEKGFRALFGKIKDRAVF